MEIAIGLGSGILMGCLMIPFKNCHKLVKFTLSVLICCGLVSVHYFYHLLAGEFLCAVIFGLVL